MSLNFLIMAAVNWHTGQVTNQIMKSVRLICSPNIVMWDKIWTYWTYFSSKDQVKWKVSHVKVMKCISSAVMFCSCCRMRAKVRDLKWSLTTVLLRKAYTHCLVLSSWRCSLSFGLEDKDNPVKFLSAFFSRQKSEVQGLWCHDWWGVTGGMVYFAIARLYSWAVFSVLLVCCFDFFLFVCFSVYFLGNL